MICGYFSEMEAAKKEFEQGIADYKLKMEKKLQKDIVKGVLEVGFALRVAILPGVLEHP